MKDMSWLQPLEDARLIMGRWETASKLEKETKRKQLYNTIIIILCIYSYIYECIYLDSSPNLLLSEEN